MVYDGELNKLSENYLKTKIVSVKFENLFKGLDIRGVRVISQDKYSANLEIDTERIPMKKLIDELITRYEIADINISGTPIEEVISKIYNRK
jgi:ABC-type uncharacterized transport system ATPase subunit